jgi:hypothetical protein
MPFKISAVEDSIHLSQITHKKEYFGKISSSKHAIPIICIDYSGQSMPVIPGESMPLYQRTNG